MDNTTRRIEGDWFPGVLPDSVRFDEAAYIESSYSFFECAATERGAIDIGRAAGLYRNCVLIVGPQGRLRIGQYSCLNDTYIVCHNDIQIGANCLFSWGVMVTDAWVSGIPDRHAWREQLTRCATQPPRGMLPSMTSHAVVIEDNVWIGFGSVVLPGTRLGRGAVVGCKSVVSGEIPPYAVVAGNPARVIRYLAADDT
jgi:acetyltransferase-like isoleucine patch superfamily enzyme